MRKFAVLTKLSNGQITLVIYDCNPNKMTDSARVGWFEGVSEDDLSDLLLAAGVDRIVFGSNHLKDHPLPEYLHHFYEQTDYYTALPLNCVMTDWSAQTLTSMSNQPTIENLLKSWGEWTWIMAHVQTTLHTDNHQPQGVTYTLSLIKWEEKFPSLDAWKEALVSYLQNLLPQFIVAGITLSDHRVSIELIERK